MYICSECKGTNVVLEATKNPNTDEIIVGDHDRGYCNDCDYDYGIEETDTPQPIATLTLERQRLQARIDAIETELYERAVKGAEEMRDG